MFSNNRLKYSLFLIFAKQNRFFFNIVQKISLIKNIVA